MTAVYYNENDPQKAAWIRELIKVGVVATGEVDERSIKEVQPEDLKGFTQCHFFAGIALWSYSLRLAGWSDNREVWTGSCPCPSFSAAGKGQGFDDPRHLWPDWIRLIRKCRPATIFGEQVNAAIGHGWLDLVQTDLEAENYAVGKAVLGACSVGAPHIRQRLYFGANALRGGAEYITRDCMEAEAKIDGRDRNLSGKRLRVGIESATGSDADAANARCNDTREHGSGSPLFTTRPEQCGDSVKRANTMREGRREKCRGSSGDEATHGRERWDGSEPDGNHQPASDGEAGGSSDTESMGRRDGNADDKRTSDGKIHSFADDHEVGQCSNSDGRIASDGNSQCSGEQRLLEEDHGFSERNNADRTRLEGYFGDIRKWRESGWLDPIEARSVADAGATRGFWTDCIWWYGRDGKYRPTQSGIQPLVAGSSSDIRRVCDPSESEVENTPEARVLRLRGYGDAIVPQLAAEFIVATYEAMCALQSS
jgi:DNA (cytosine-5)-methyltransferase 1